MQGAAFIIISAIALVRGASIDVEVNNNGCPVDFTIEKLLPHENCNQFYQCVSGIPIAKTCPSKLFFNIDSEECDWLNNVECGERIIPEDSDNGGNNGNENEGNGENNHGGNGHSDPSEAPAICAAEGSDGVLIAHEDCTKFYKCWQSRPVAVSCPSSLFYNPAKEQCDWPWNVQCDRTTPDLSKVNGVTGGVVINSDPSEAPAICAAEGSDSILVAHENCNQFYKCFSGRPISMKCPSNLLYNYNTEQCDWPENVDCGDRVIPEENDDESNDNVGIDNDNGNDGDGDDESDNNGGNSDPSEAPAICASENSSNVLVAHENCNQFYKCWNGTPVPVNCPSNLLFNPALNICDWPENVDCRDRVTNKSNIVQIVN